jgi:aspartyl-tRNA(Asn)/glutamyl-tRNA(Gln) amidotransferase subunit C
MKIDEKLLQRLEKLSSLRVPENKKEEIISQLSDIVGFVENLNELDTSSLDAVFSVVKESATLREDIPKKDETTSTDILKHSPASEGTFFVVPKIIE